MRHLFELTSAWNLPHTVSQVWDSLQDVEAWPTWWPYVLAVTVLEHGDNSGIGARQQFVWSSALRYRLQFTMHVTEIDKERRIVAAADGDLTGRGIWTLTPNAEGTALRYDWQVAVTQPWMAHLAPALRPIYAWNHSRVMAAGERGLARHLAATTRSQLASTPTAC